jgi:hypothetical protein
VLGTAYTEIGMAGKRLNLLWPNGSAR